MADGSDEPVAAQPDARKQPLTTTRKIGRLIGGGHALLTYTTGAATFGLGAGVSVASGSGGRGTVRALVRVGSRLTRAARDEGLAAIMGPGRTRLGRFGRRLGQRFLRSAGGDVVMWMTALLTELDQGMRDVDHYATGGVGNSATDAMAATIEHGLSAMFGMRTPQSYAASLRDAASANIFGRAMLDGREGITSHIRDGARDATVLQGYLTMSTASGRASRIGTGAVILGRAFSHLRNPLRIPGAARAAGKRLVGQGTTRLRQAGAGVRTVVDQALAPIIVLVKRPAGVSRTITNVFRRQPKAARSPRPASAPGAPTMSWGRRGRAWVNRNGLAAASVGARVAGTALEIAAGGARLFVQASASAAALGMAAEAPGAAQVGAGTAALQRLRGPGPGAARGPGDTGQRARAAVRSAHTRAQRETAPARRRTRQKSRRTDRGTGLE